MSAPQHDTDRNLLFVVLALQADFLTQQQFVEACTLWAGQKETAVSGLLTARGWLTSDDVARVEGLLARELTKHGGDARAGLAEATQTLHVRASLDAVPDDSVRATISAGPESAGTATVTRAPGAADPASNAGAVPEGGERYSITRLHATGGIGRVWVARDESLKRDVALKDLRPERAANSAVWGRFLREAQITGQLEHPGIVPIYELGRRADGQPFYTMRLISGQTLREKIAEYHQKRERGAAGALDLRELLTAFVGVCNTLAYAHSRGVVHRDLKPANVVLGPFGEVMVLDWGLAKEVRATDAATETADGPPPVLGSGSFAPVSSSGDASSATLEGQVLGTPAYMAPEQAEGRLADIDARTDVYGLGAILYEVLTGKPPFGGGPVTEVLERVRTTAPERPSARVAGMPRALEAICLKALAKHRGDRYAGAKELADDVLRFQADEPTSAYREPFAARAWRWSRRHRSLVTALVAVLAVAVPILVVGMVLVNESEGRERDARKQEESARKDEEKARERAQANYQRSLRAADALAEELARGIRPIAGTQTKTVLEILDRAKVITDDLISDTDVTPEALERKARMLVQFSELYRDSNRTGPARQSAEQSLALYERLLVIHPDDRRLRIERAKARNRIGWVLYDQSRLPEALAAFRACIAELEAVGGVEADPVLAASFLASAYTFAANVLVLYGDHDGAEKMYERGLAIRRKAVADAKDNPTVRTQLTISLERYGAFIARYRSERRQDGLRMLREARKETEALCAADPWDSVLHMQLSKVLTNLAEAADETESASCVAAGEKIVERFVRRDPDHVLWQREQLRIDYYRILHKLKTPQRLDPAVLWDLRRAERDAVEGILAAIRPRNAQDPENYLWRGDIANLEARLSQAYLVLSVYEVRAAAEHLSAATGNVAEAVPAVVALRDAVRDAPVHLARARELTLSALGHYEAVLARAPMNTETEWGLHTSRLRLWEIERERNDRPAAVVARWVYEAGQIAQAHRLAAAYPTSKYWELQIRRSYFSLAMQWRASAYRRCSFGTGSRLRVNLELPAWDRLTRPEVMAALVRLAAVVADVPEGFSQELRDNGEGARKAVATLLRALDAQGMLPPEGKKALEKLSLLEKKE